MRANELRVVAYALKDLPEAVTQAESAEARLPCRSHHGGYVPLRGG